MIAPPSVFANALYDGQKSAGTLGTRLCSAWLARFASPACAAVTPLARLNSTTAVSLFDTSCFIFLSFIMLPLGRLNYTISKHLRGIKNRKKYQPPRGQAPRKLLFYWLLSPRRLLCPLTSLHGSGLARILAWRDDSCSAGQKHRRAE